jgi:hypothetical protein
MTKESAPHSTLQRLDSAPPNKERVFGGYPTRNELEICIRELTVQTPHGSPEDLGSPN